MTIEVEGPGGVVVEFPDNMSPDAIHGVMTENFAPQPLKERFAQDFGANFGPRTRGSRIAESLATGDNPYVDPSTGGAMPGALAANAPGAAIAGAASAPFWGPPAAAAARVAGTAGGLGAVAYEALRNTENPEEHFKELLHEVAKDFGLAWILKTVGHK